jgi:hypothetical protein
LVLGVAGVGGGEPLANGQVGAVVLVGGGGVAEGDSQVANLVVADGEAALVFGVAGVGGGEPLGDGQEGAVVLVGGGDVAEVDGQVAELWPCRPRSRPTSC